MYYTITSQFHRVLRTRYNIEGVPSRIPEHILGRIRAPLGNSKPTHERILKIIKEINRPLLYEDVYLIVSLLKAGGHQSLPHITLSELETITKIFQEYYRISKIMFPHGLVPMYRLADKIPRQLGIIPLTMESDKYLGAWNSISASPEIQALISRHRAAARIQKTWRQVLARRHLQRLRLGRDIECFPGKGTVYKRARKSYAWSASKQDLVKNMLVLTASELESID